MTRIKDDYITFAMSSPSRFYRARIDTHIGSWINHTVSGMLDEFGIDILTPFHF
jgi:hypothetical protein